jgi:hypothetical protein
VKKLIAAVALLAVAGACLSRRPAEVGTPVRVPALPKVVESPAVARSTEPDPLRRTADTLHLSSQAAAFTVAAQDAVAQLHRAHVRRQEDWSVPSPEVQVSIDSDVTYESERQAALDRLEPFLDQSPAHREFRDNFETWAATVWARSQGYGRRSP